MFTEDQISWLAIFAELRAAFVTVIQALLHSCLAERL